MGNSSIDSWREAIMQLSAVYFPVNLARTFYNLKHPVLNYT